ncbi:MAG: tRNA pseudouridine(38-40) synthase TruA [Ignavibacteria bacterium]
MRGTEIDSVNIRLNIEYNGKKYFGWQRQSERKPSHSKNKPTIQQTIEEALQVLFPEEKISLIGAGRTDTGVHAFGQVANFRLKSGSLHNKSLDRVKNSLNAILPPDISVTGLSKCKPDFHSRYSAKKRIYVYYFSTRKSAVLSDFTCKLKTKFDIDLAKDYCKLLVGNNDFRNYCKNKSDKHEFRSIVYYAKVSKLKNGIISFEICANRFLHSMVRALAGVLLQVAGAKLTIEEFKNKFKKGEPLKIQYVPSNALFLKKIIY